jgi:hypothetical protein
MKMIKFQRGDLVRYFYDTGAMGVTLIWGLVINAGPKAFRVRWESGHTNWLKHTEPKGVTPVTNIEEAREAFAQFARRQRTFL